MTSIGGLSPVASFLSTEKDEQTSAQRYIKTNPSVLYAVKNFRQKASSIHSASDLMKNYSAEQVVLKAYGLSSLSGQPAIVKALLTQDSSSPKSLAKKSHNASWLAFADAFKTWGQNGGKSSESTTITMSGSVGTLPNGDDQPSQKYFTPTVIAHTRDGDPYQVDLTWTQDSNDPLSWSVSAHADSLSTQHLADISSHSFNVSFNTDGSLASVIDPNGNLIDIKGQQASIVLFASYDGDEQSFTLNLGKIGLSNGVIMARAMVKQNTDSVNPLVVTASYSKTPFNCEIINSITNNYELTEFENSKDNKSSGVGDALYFVRKIGSIKSITQLMSDPKLLRVAEVVSGYDPNVIGGLDFSQQLRIMSNKVNIKEFSTSKGIQQYAERYLTIIQNNPQYNKDEDSKNTVLDLFGGNSGDDYHDQIVSLFS